MFVKSTVLVSVLAVAVGFAGAAHAMGSKPEAGSSSKSSAGSAKGDYTAGEKAVRARQYKKAISRLQKVVAKQPRNVDALNYLGYSYRQLGNYRQALGYYRLALKINPSHRGANEYIGQLFLRTGNVKGAKAQLSRLRSICPSGCEEYDSLRSALAKRGVKS